MDVGEAKAVEEGIAHAAILLGPISMQKPKALARQASDWSKYMELPTRGLEHIRVNYFILFIHFSNIDISTIGHEHFLKQLLLRQTGNVGSMGKNNMLAVKPFNGPPETKRRNRSGIKSETKIVDVVMPSALI